MNGIRANKSSVHIIDGPVCTTECDKIDEEEAKKADEAENINCDNLDVYDPTISISIHCFPKEQYFPAQAKFAYTMFFLLIPWPFFIYEFFTSRQYHIFVNQWRDIVKEISSCNGMYFCLFLYLRGSPNK